MQRTEWPACLLRVGSASIGALGMRGSRAIELSPKGRGRRAVLALRMSRTAMVRSPLQEVSRGLGVAVARSARSRC